MPSYTLRQLSDPVGNLRGSHTADSRDSDDGQGQTLRGPLYLPIRI